MAKIRVKPPKKGAKQTPAKGFRNENLRGIPCLVLVLLAMALLFVLFFFSLQGK